MGSNYYWECVLSSNDSDKILTQQLREGHQELLNERFLLHQAVLKGCVKTVRALYGTLGDPTRANENGRTVLYIAAIYGKTEIMRFLLSKFDSADIMNIRDRNFQTPLTLATRMGHIDAAEMLAESSSDLTIRDRAGKTVMHYAVLYCPHLISIITAKNTDVLYISDNDRRTLIYIATRSGSARLTLV